MGRFIDERGQILDLLGEIDSVTEISTAADAVRGNHFHKLTTQWTYPISGKMIYADSSGETEIGPGWMMQSGPNEPHAWRAIEDCTCLVFTKGPRSGENYESDTYRLEEPLL